MPLHASIKAVDKCRTERERERESRRYKWEKREQTVQTGIEGADDKNGERKSRRYKWGKREKMMYILLILLAKERLVNVLPIS